MKNGKLNTSQMIRLLVKHANDPVPWTATAPSVESEGSVPGGWAAMSATAGGPGVFLETDTGVALSCVPWREDWTIHRNGKACEAPKGLFPLGGVVMTSGAEKAFSEETRSKCLQRHARGDWGDVNSISKRNNDRVIKSGGRIFSVYRDDVEGDYNELWIITEGEENERVTTLLLPEEY